MTADARELEQAWQEVQPDAARRLLIAAVEAFAARGFHATTTRDIARGAGLSPAGVYVHYGSKEELLYRITLIGHQQTGRLMRAATVGSSEPAEQLRSLVRDLTSWQARFHTTARVVEYELHFLSEEHHTEIAALRREMQGLVERILEVGTAQGEFDVADVPTTALALLSLSVDVVRWYHPSARLNPEDLGRHYADLALRMVSAGRPA
ncbi:TetR/AcrR family transcriptional regulator [Streptacidiphilus sp. MAP12-20]|uniref:TetR/AcrR family transcriptional regulator n=1 Tax=Streptacidiphilus sp. MAP12-20 TaxID=3156299 RepID=UPI0035199695